MTRYIIRRLLQAVPTLLFISLIVYGLIIVSPVDPLAIYEENPNITPEDMAMLEYRLGLRQPAFLNFRGSSGRINEYVVLTNKPPGSEGTPPKETGQLGAGTQVAVVDEKKNDTGVYVKVLEIASRTTGWTYRSNVDIKVNPLDSRYFKWLFALLQGDFGRSNVERRPALEMMLERLPNTIFLMSIAFIGQLVVGLPIGIVSALRQYSLFDHVFTILAYAGRSIPIFWFGLILIIVFNSTLTWPAWAPEALAGRPLFPGGGMYDVRLKQELGYVPWWDRVWHLVLPVTMLAVFGAAQYMRYMRSSMLEVIHQDYIRTARAKGLAERAVIYSHALKNAAIPIVTIMALELPILFAGALFTETIFSWPGMGKLFFRSAQRVDYAVLMGYLMITAALIIFFNIVADIVYGFLDPRIRYD
jgi:peptide/nickel transport system permease protein